MTAFFTRSPAWTTRYLLFIAGMGGLLYGIDAGIIAGALFVASFAVGPGVCVWLALSELMPTRIRSNGMSVALLINQFVSASIAAVFLPTVGRHGYSTIFFAGAACTVVDFLAAAFLLPETRGRTLEEIDTFFARPAAK